MYFKTTVLVLSFVLNAAALPAPDTPLVTSVAKAPAITLVTPSSTGTPTNPPKPTFRVSTHLGVTCRGSNPVTSSACGNCQCDWNGEVKGCWVSSNKLADNSQWCAWNDPRGGRCTCEYAPEVANVGCFSGSGKDFPNGMNRHC